jgi:hypothetical protein
VTVFPALSHRQAHADAEPDALVFPTSSGSRRDEDNARERVIRPVVAHAETLLAGPAQERLLRQPDSCRFEADWALVPNRLRVRPRERLPVGGCVYVTADRASTVSA